MNALSDAPQARYHQSQGLRLHYTDWGNASAPPLLLVHGGLDHSRSWDHVARALRTNFHVIAPDLRGHGDSEWAVGSSYSLADHVYDLTCLVKAEGLEKVAVVGHSMGGMVSLTYAGAFPEKVSRLAVLDGVTNFPARRVKPIELRIADWVGDLDKTAQRKTQRYGSVSDGADRMLGRNWLSAGPRQEEGPAALDATPEGAEAFALLGIDLKAQRARRRRFACTCIDWSERRAHLGGALGAAFLDACASHGWIENTAKRRVLRVTPAGHSHFERFLSDR